VKRNGREVKMVITIDKKTGAHTIDNVGQVDCGRVQRLAEVSVGTTTEHERAEEVSDSPVDVLLDR